MECLLAIACIYVEIAIGVHHQPDVEAYRMADDVYLGNPELVTRPNPLGRYKIGIERDFLDRRVTVFGDVRHESSMAIGDDEGDEGAWVGARVRF